MNVTTVRLDSFHVALLEPFAGYGKLVCPNPSTDVRVSSETVYRAALADVLRRLDQLGWEPLEDEHGVGMCLDGYTADGRPIYGLIAREPIVGEVDLGDIAEADAILRQALESVGDGNPESAATAP